MLKKTLGMLALLLMLLGLPAAAPAFAEEGGPELSEWTVMFYFCGSDLESERAYATGNLEEISYCLTYDTISNFRENLPDIPPDTEAVNVVIETGGSKKWHAESLGMDVRTDVLQRWHFRPARNYLQNTVSMLEKDETFDSRSILEKLAQSIHDSAAMELEQVLPLASMAEPETLSDFIRWSAENYPAKKYALVLWDHGTGAVDGLIIDELFNDDTMRLDELKTALHDGGVHFEAVLFDACLMASFETACAIKDDADWMIASEELVAGKGTAMHYWLQQIFCSPHWDGKQLGQSVCELTQQKYAEKTSEMLENTLTWSLIDLKKIDRVAAAFDRFFALADSVYVNSPAYMIMLCKAFNDSFEFGFGDADMIDLTRIPYHPSVILGLDQELYVELLDALEDAVVCNVHGSSRANAGGLSFCYAGSLSPEKLDAYARVCPSAHYLALLDAINPGWHAPDWVFEQAEKLPEIADFPAYQISVEKGIGPDGKPNIAIVGSPSLWSVHVDVSRLNPDTGNTLWLGSTVASFTVDRETNRAVFSLPAVPEWPTLEDVHCSAQLVTQDYLGRALYNVPITMDGEIYLLRCGMEDPSKLPVVYGLWEDYNADSGVFGRNVIPLSEVAGREFSMIYPIESPEGSRTRYESSKPLTMYRSLEISSKPLEPGTYYFDYWVEDIFLRSLPVGRVELDWDGTTITVPPESNWQGTFTLTVQ